MSASVVVMLDARRPKSAYLQFLAADMPRSKAQGWAAHVRDCVARGERLQHAVDRLIALHRQGCATAPQVSA